jgi:transposase
VAPGRRRGGQLRGYEPARSRWFAFRDGAGPYLDEWNRQVLLAYEVFAQPNDAGTVGPMLARLAEQLGERVRVLLADAGYAGGADLAVAQAAAVTLYAPWQENDFTKAKAGGRIPKKEFRRLAAEQTYACPRGHRLEFAGASQQKRSGTEHVVLYQYGCAAGHCRECPLRQRCTSNPEAGRTISRGEHEDLIEALRQRMATEEAKALYRLRKQTVERANADLKGHRKLRRFSGRGLERARTEVGLTALAHNLLTLQDCRNPQQDDSPATPIPQKSGG